MPVRLLPVFLLVVFLTAPLYGTVIQVEGPQDSLEGPPDINHCTLRKAIINANTDTAAYPQCAAGSGIDVIEFLSPMTIALTRSGAGEDAALTGDLDITQSVTINGDSSGGTVIDGAALDRIFHINPLNNISGITVTLNNLHLRNGSGLGGGGAIWMNNATLNLNNVTISGSRAREGDGGAIFMDSSGTLNMTNCTVSGNSAAFHAGAIIFTGTSTIKSCTITGNSSDTGLTGGLRALGTVNLRNTIVAGNTNSSPLNYIPNLDGTFTSLGYNVIGDLGAQSGNPVITATTGDQFGVVLANIYLGPLQVNGSGPPTRELQTGSVAIDKGQSSSSTTDERGLTRPCDLASITNATGGDGADVGAFEVQGTCGGTNTDPVASDDTATIAEDSGANSINVLANDTDADGDSLTIDSVTQGTHGSVANNNTSLTYSPAGNFFGSDSFTYTISDGHGGAATAAVHVTVTNVEDAPDANNDLATIAEDSGANTINVLANDTDADGDSLTITSVTQGAHGSVASSVAALTYAPASNFFGSDSFTYTISDGHGGTDSATVFVTVTNVNDPPVADVNSYTINQDTILNVAAPGVLGNDTDVDGDSLTSVLVGNVAHGTLTLSANGSFTYTPTMGFAGTDSFSYKANDGHVDSNTVAVTIHVLDTQPPAINSSIATGVMWPPNHDLVNVGFAFNVSDNSGGAITTQLDVFSDEDDVRSESGDQSPDARNIASGTLRLRSERSAKGDGRVYLIRILATDPSANTSRSCLTVVVPKSQSGADSALVAQRADTARAACMATGLPPAGYFIVGDGPVSGPKQ